MIITIDGTAGSGKSSTAREVARRLGFLHLESGAFYRAFARVAARRGWTGPDGDVREDRLDALATADVRARGTEHGVVIEVDGEELGEEELRAPAVTAAASRVAAHPAVRARVNQLLRRLAAEYPGGTVTEGRDMGTIVFPDADLKIYMVADPEERARRRLEQEGGTPTVERIREEARRLEDRDRADSTRPVAPLRRAPDAVVIDTTRLDFENQVRRVVELARDQP